MVLIGTEVFAVAVQLSGFAQLVNCSVWYWTRTPNMVHLAVYADHWFVVIMNGIVVLLDERRPTTMMAWFPSGVEGGSMDMNPLVGNYAAAP